MARDRYREKARQTERASYRSAQNSNRYYQYSSEALELAPLPEEEPEAPPLRRPARKRKRPLTPKEKKALSKQRSKQIRQRNAPQYVYETKGERTISIPVIITACLVFLGALAYVGTFSMAAVTNITVQARLSELKKVKDSNMALESNMASQYDLESIQDVAMARLGMVKPADYQVVYINVPESRYAVQYDVDQHEAEPEWTLNRLFDLLASND